MSTRKAQHSKAILQQKSKIDCRPVNFRQFFCSHRLFPITNYKRTVSFSKCRTGQFLSYSANKETNTWSCVGDNKLKCHRYSFVIFSARCNIYISRLCYDVSVRLSVTEVHWVSVHAGNTAAAPASEVEAIIRSPTNMAAADVAAVEGRSHLALC